MPTDGRAGAPPGVSRGACVDERSRTGEPELGELVRVTAAQGPAEPCGIIFYVMGRTDAEAPCATLVEEARRGRGEDRTAVVRLRGRTLIVVADGAGGVGRGAEAAEFVCTALRSLSPTDHHELDWADWLADLDRRMAASSSGLAAAVVVELRSDGAVRGASVGDCEAWLFDHGAQGAGRGERGARELTSSQVRKPLLGEGTATPVSFEANAAGGTLLVASDGLWKYAKRDRIAAAAAKRPLEAATTALVDLVRLRSGALQDDVAVGIAG